MPRILKLLLKIVSSAALVATLILSGLVVCINASGVTLMLSSATCNTTESQYSKEQLANAAEYTRQFSVGDISKENLESLLSSLSIDKGALEDNALSHLQDCTPIFKTVSGVFFVCLITSAITLAISFLLRGKSKTFRQIKRVCITAIVLLVAFTLFVIFDFENLFIAMHRLLFSQGNWTFDASSLLIRMYPENFWVGMGGVWIVISAGISLILLSVSSLLSK